MLLSDAAQSNMNLYTEAKIYFSLFTVVYLGPSHGLIKLVSSFDILRYIYYKQWLYLTLARTSKDDKSKLMPFLFAD